MSIIRRKDRYLQRITYFTLKQGELLTLQNAVFIHLAIRLYAEILPSTGSHNLLSATSGIKQAIITRFTSEQYANNLHHLFFYIFPTLLIYLKISLCSCFFSSLQQLKSKLSSWKFSFSLTYTTVLPYVLKYSAVSTAWLASLSLFHINKKYHSLIAHVTLIAINHCIIYCAKQFFNGCSNWCGSTVHSP